MESSSVLENSNNNGSGLNQEKPKGKFNKKILIICSLITILIIAAVVFIITTRYSKMVENYLNTELSRNAEILSESFTYKPFKCSGFKNITCNSDFIEFKDNGQKVFVKNLSITAVPSLNELQAGITGSIEVSAVKTASDNIITLNFNCSDNMILLSERSLLAHNLICDTKLNNIHSNQNSVFYMKNDTYAQNSSMIGVIKAFAEQNIDIQDQLKNFTVIESSSTKIESPALLDDIISLMQLVTQSYNSNILTKEMIVSAYDSVKKDYNNIKNYYNNDKYTSVIDNLIAAIDGVVYKGNNSISMTISIKDKNTIDDIFQSDYIKFMLPDIYDIEIASSK